MSDSTRYTMVLDGPAVDLVDRLQAVHGLKSRAAVFDLALNLANWITSEIEEGHEVGRKRGDTFEALLLPTRLQEVAKAAARARAQTTLAHAA